MLVDPDKVYNWMKRASRGAHLMITTVLLRSSPMRVLVNYTSAMKHAEEKRRQEVLIQHQATIRGMISLFGYQRVQSWAEERMYREDEGMRCFPAGVCLQIVYYDSG